MAAVIAVPGSGKTLVMMERIGNLVKIHNVQPETIIGLTFNRNAAEQMRQRLVPVLGELAQRVTLSTIHSWCHYLLRTEGKVFEIISGKEQISLIRNLMKRKRLDLSVGTILREISLAKNNLIDVEEFRALYGSDKTMSRVAGIYESYEKEKAKKYLLDFDDLLLETYFLLSGHESIREKYTGRYHHILIDEFQDTNPVQLEIIKLIIDANHNNDKSYWIAGDDWQSIYSFAGASINNILNFQSTFSSSRLFILNINYRSTPQILKACQNLISHNVRKIEKTLKTENQDGDNVIVLESSSEEGEALSIINEIRDLVDNRGYSYKDIAILYRANFQSRVIEETLAQMKIPYYIENGLNFYQRSEVRYILDYLRLILNPDSDEGDEALRSILNVPNRYISRKFLQELAEFSDKTNVHLYEGLKSMPVDLPYVRKNVKDFIRFISPLADYASNLEPSEVIAMIRTELDYDRFVTDEDIPAPDDVKIQNLNQLQLSAARYSGIRSFLEYTDSFSEQMSNDREGVALMTIHKAKGLEFPAVFVIGLVEGITPTKKGDLEEERRIVFVAISRAMRILYISYSHTYMGQAAKKSLFIDEIMGTDKHSTETA
ncbi:MAG TPA: 3'-5' exonuclease [Syntrophales bacterium]|nr:3'-5' exonuclease [Syntrophales bacterium]